MNLRAGTRVRQRMLASWERNARGMASLPLTFALEPQRRSGHEHLQELEG